MTVLLQGFKTMLSCSWSFKPHFTKQLQSPQLPCSLLLLLLLQAIINWEVSVMEILCFSRQSPSKTAWHLSVSPTLPFSTLSPNITLGMTLSVSYIPQGDVCVCCSSQWRSRCVGGSSVVVCCVSNLHGSSVVMWCVSVLHSSACIMGCSLHGCLGSSLGLWDNGSNRPQTSFEHTFTCHIVLAFLLPKTNQFMLRIW